MPTVTIKCPKNGDFLTTRIDLVQSSDNDVVPCPSCGSFHKLTKKSAYVILPIAEYEKLKMLRSAKSAESDGSGG